MGQHPVSRRATTPEPACAESGAICGVGQPRFWPDASMDSRRGQRITHLDVARLAGVSPAVVSYVINNGPRATSAEARARVLAAIEELDYHPHAFARGLRSQRTHTIGFLARDYSPLDVFVSPYSAGILTGLAAELKEHSYYLLV